MNETFESQLSLGRAGEGQGAMSHHFFPFRTTTFDSSGQNYSFKWYIYGLQSLILKNPASSRKKELNPFFHST